MGTTCSPHLTTVGVYLVVWSWSTFPTNISKVYVLRYNYMVTNSTFLIDICQPNPVLIFSMFCWNYKIFFDTIFLALKLAYEKRLFVWCNS